MPDTTSVIGELKIIFDAKHYAYLKYVEEQDAITLETIVVPADFRKLGYGSLLMNRLISIAETFQRDIKLSARPIAGGGMSDERLERLVAYYQRFGFVPLERGVTAVKMIREFVAPELSSGSR